MTRRQTAHRVLGQCAAALVAAVLLAGMARSLAQESKAERAAAPAAGAEASEPVVPAPTAPAEAPALIATDSLFHIVVQGGWLMIPIIGCSFILVLFVLERTVSLRRGRVIPGPFVKRFMHQIKEGELNRDSALELCLENKSPVADVFAHAVRKWGRPAVEVEQAIIDGGERTVNSLRRYLRVLNGVATISPLLGLLGTVTGMIAAFNAIANSQAMGRPELLAAGISEALITTAAGLSVAIPALIFYMFFVSRVDQLIIEIDALGQELVHLISAEATARPAATTRTSADKEKPATRTRRSEAA
jgi:biopolymer transport protein ExbB